MTEEWRDVVGFEGVYAVSDQGRVKRNAPGPGTYVGRILRPVLLKNGYLSVVLCTNNLQVRHYVHVLVAEAFLGPRPEGKETNHKSGDKMDNQVANLEWVTRSENALHARSVLGLERGEANGNSKLTEADVREIRNLYAAGADSQQQLADQYGVNEATVSRVVRRERWSWL